MAAFDALRVRMLWSHTKPHPHTPAQCPRPLPTAHAAYGLRPTACRPARLHARCQPPAACPLPACPLAYMTSIYQQRIYTYGFFPVQIYIHYIHIRHILYNRRSLENASLYSGSALAVNKKVHLSLSQGYTRWRSSAPCKTWYCSAAMRAFI